MEPLNAREIQALRRSYNFHCRWRGRIFEGAMRRPPCTEDDAKWAESLTRVVCDLADIIDQARGSDAWEYSFDAKSTAVRFARAWKRVNPNAKIGRRVVNSLAERISRAFDQIQRSAEHLEPDQIRRYIGLWSMD